MQTQIGHILFNIDSANAPFYKDLLTFLGWQSIYEGDGMLGMSGPGDTSLWFSGEVKPVSNDYDGPGMNHFAFAAQSQVDVDATAGYLQQRSVECLFGTPQHRPEFSSGPDQTYYQVMFASPDRVLFEVVYTGPKTA